MPFTAFLLVSFAALAHATWNFLAKRAAHSKHLIWLASVTEAVVLGKTFINRALRRRFEIGPYQLLNHLPV